MRIVNFLGLVYVQTPNGAFIKGPFVDGRDGDAANTAYMRALRYITRSGEKLIA